MRHGYNELATEGVNKRSNTCVLLSLVLIATAQIHNGEKHFFTYPSKCAICVVSATAGIRRWSTWNDEVRLLNDSRSFIHFSPTSFLHCSQQISVSLDNAQQIPQAEHLLLAQILVYQVQKAESHMNCFPRFNPKISKSNMYVHSFLRFPQYAQGVPFTSLLWNNVVNKRQLQSPTH